MSTKFTPEALLQFLIARYAYLDDNNVKAQQVYDSIIARQSK